jgi:hypothetical protein
MKKIMMVITLGIMSGLYADTVTLPSPGQPTQNHEGKPLLNILSYPYTNAKSLEESSLETSMNVMKIATITSGAVISISFQYWRQANQIIKILEEQLNSDDDTDAFIKKTISGLKKGKSLILATLGVATTKLLALLFDDQHGSMPISSAIANLTDNRLVKNTLSSTLHISKGAIGAYYAHSINKDIAMVKQELAKKDDGGDALDVEHLDVALKVLNLGCILALTIAITNGIDTAALISSPLWLK